MQSTIVRTQVAGLPEVRWCEDCTHDVQLVRAAGYGGGQDLIYLATDQRSGRQVCGRHASMHDELAADIAADEADEVDDLTDLLALVEATVWADGVDAAQAEIDEVWAVAS